MKELEFISWFGMVRKLMLALRYLRTFFLKRWGLLFRGAICLGLSLFILKNDESTSFDFRFNARGTQTLDHRIVLIKIQESDLSLFKDWSRNRIIPLKEVFEFSDRVYWDQNLWSTILQEILKQKPAKIGVSLVFSKSQLTELKEFKNPQNPQNPAVIWATWASEENELISSNLASPQLFRDDDGLVRKVKTLSTHFVEKLTDIKFPENSLFINYRALPSQIPTYSISDLLSKNLSANEFEGKFVLIGTAAQASQKYLTPLGNMDLVDVLAQAVDNNLNHRWIKRSPSVFISGFLLALLVICIVVLGSFPQSVSFTILCWVALLVAAISAWIFDSFSIWIPAATPILQILFTWILFVGHQINQLEKNQWVLLQEQKLNIEFEQLKNNFISLISHDLKTPIAKIQGITERLLLNDSSKPIAKDLKTLSQTGEELNRYIQSILKVLRVEARDFRIYKESADLNESALEAILQLKELAFEKNVKIVEDFEPLFSFEYDSTLIKEVCLNLVDNAIKYSPVGGVVVVKTREALDKVIFEVQDSGEGIAADEVPLIWGKFVRGKNQSLKSKGTGLGLYLVKYFVELHGGTVSIESQLGFGTKVSFTLPLESDNSFSASNANT